MRAGRQILYASTVAGIGLGVRSALGHPLPLPVIAGSSAVFFGVVLAGVLEPRLGMYADVFCRGERVTGNEPGRVALTFDDGPSAEHTPRLLDLLDEAGLAATFFVVGRKLAGEGARVVRDAVARGHQIGCHSFAHHRLFSLRSEAYVRADVTRALAAVEDATGEKTSLFRPPIGHTNPTIARVADELELTLIGWSTRCRDGVRGADEARVLGRATRGLSDGAILLLHDAAERDDFTPIAPRVLPALATAVRERGLRSVTIGEMLKTPASNAEPDEESEPEA